VCDDRSHCRELDTTLPAVCPHAAEEESSVDEDGDYDDERSDDDEDYLGYKDRDLDDEDGDDGKA
jgi:hypothetical protein